MKKPDSAEPKPVTAQVPDYCMPFGVNSRGKEHRQRYGDHETVSDNKLTRAAGCYRRVPTCKE